MKIIKKKMGAFFAASVVFIMTTFSTVSYAESIESKTDLLDLYEQEFNEADCLNPVLSDEQIVEKNRIKESLKKIMESDIEEFNTGKIIPLDADEEKWSEGTWNNLEKEKIVLSKDIVYPSSYNASVSHVSQSNSYYCGPAVAEMLLSLTSTPASQSQIAISTYLNTDNAYATPIAKMWYGLNYWQAVHHYPGSSQWSYSKCVSTDISDSEEYINLLKFTIYLDYATGISGWSPANTSATGHMPGYPATDVYHWVVCYGWTNNGNIFYISDPTSGKYWGPSYNFTNVSDTYPVTKDKLKAFIFNGIVY